MKVWSGVVDADRIRTINIGMHSQQYRQTMPAECLLLHYFWHSPSLISCLLAALPPCVPSTVALTYLYASDPASAPFCLSFCVHHLLNHYVQFRISPLEHVLAQ
jgi:hypothetical protein